MVKNLSANTGDNNNIYIYIYNYILYMLYIYVIYIYITTIYIIQEVTTIYDNNNINMVVLYLLSCYQLFATPWTVACQGFPRQEYWSGLPLPSPGDFPIQGLKPCFLHILLGRWILYHWATSGLHTPSFFSITGYYKILNIIPCAIQ